MNLPNISASGPRSCGYDGSVLGVGRRRLSACTDACQCDGARGCGSVECGRYQVG